MSTIKLRLPFFSFLVLLLGFSCMQEPIKPVVKQQDATSYTVIEGYGGTGTAGLAAIHDGSLYALQGGHLWRTSTSGGSTSVGPIDWQGAQHFFARPIDF